MATKKESPNRDGHTDFASVFTNGHVFTTRDGDVPVTVETVGKLVTPSGTITAAEPSNIYFEYLRRPFTRSVQQVESIRGPAMPLGASGTTLAGC
jgi:hypothetical protein